jgi:hypothetical protein
MPLSEVSINQDRGWSADSRNSMEDHFVFPRSATPHPQTQPRNVPSETDAQIDDGFARFLKQHSSPTHQRVTAGGRIVPMEPIPAPPQFSLPTDTSARGKNGSSPQKSAENPKIGNKRPVPVLNSNTILTADLPTVSFGHSQQNVNSIQEQDVGTSQSARENTSAGGLENGHRMLRPSDLAHVTTASSIGLPQSLTSSTSSFSLYPQAFTHNQWGTSVYPCSGMLFNPYANMLIPSGDRPPILPTPTIPNVDFSSTSGVNQTNLPITCGEEIDFRAQQSLQPSFRASYNQSMPLTSTSSNQLSHPGSALLRNSMRTMETSQGNSMWQIGTHSQADQMGQIPAADMSINSMLTSHPLAPASKNTTSKVTEGDVSDVEREFQRLDKQLRDHDQYTAAHYLLFTAQVKSNYAAQRMELVQHRAMARGKWMQLRAALDEARSAQQNLSGPSNYQHTSTIKDGTSASTQKIGNTNLNVQAAAWIPKQMNQPSGVPNTSQSGGVNVVKSANGEKSATSKADSGHQSFAARMHQQAGFTPAETPNMQSVTSSFSHVKPGPYTKHVSDASCSELSDQDVDEWGARRGRAPPELAQKQSEEEMDILSQQRAEWGARTRSAPASLLQDAGNSSMQASLHPVDEWGVRIGRAPLEVAQQQSQQGAKLAKMHPDQRSQVSLATLDSLPSGKSNAPKTVSFAEDNAHAVYRNGHGSDDGGLSFASSDESGWRPMKSGAASGPTKADWQSLVEAGNKPKGMKTKIHLATGESIVVEGTGPRVPPFSTASKGDKSEGTPKHHSRISEEERAGITKQLMSIEKGVWGLEEATRKPGSSGFNPWAIPDENNFFRNKGLSSVAIQSVTAQGTVPGFDGASNRPECKALKPLPTAGFKANSSPPKRSLKDIWAGASPRAHVDVADHEEVTRDVGKAMCKY